MSDHSWNGYPYRHGDVVPAGFKVHYPGGAYAPYLVQMSGSDRLADKVDALTKEIAELRRRLGS